MFRRMKAISLQVTVQPSPVISSYSVTRWRVCYRKLKTRMTLPTVLFKLATLELRTITQDQEDKTTEETDKGNFHLGISQTVKSSPSLASRIATSALKPEEQMLLSITLLEIADTDLNQEE